MTKSSLSYQFNRNYPSKNKKNNFQFFSRIFVFQLGPNGQHPFRTLNIGQRPFLDSSFSSHLRDLESFRRKAPVIPTTNATTSSTHPTTNGLISSDCQGYKPNAPQIQGKKIEWRIREKILFWHRTFFPNQKWLIRKQKIIFLETCF